MASAIQIMLLLAIVYGASSAARLRRGKQQDRSQQKQKQISSFGRSIHSRTKSSLRNNLILLADSASDLAGGSGELIYLYSGETITYAQVVSELAHMTAKFYNGGIQKSLFDN